MLEERLGLNNPSCECRKEFGQLRGSRKPGSPAEFASAYSETWMIILSA